MKKIAFAGTFDPVTEGHLWVVAEALQLADEVVVFVAENAGKSPMFSAEQRVSIFEDALSEKGWSSRVSVVSLRGAYVARAAKHYGADYLIRGIRSTVDFDYENLLQQANTEVLHGAKTVFVMPPRDLGAVSSSYVKGWIGPPGWHWCVSEFLPRSAYKALIRNRLSFYWNTFVNNDGYNLDFEAIIAMYDNPSRVYHNLDHLMHMLDEIYAHPDFESYNSNDKHELIKSTFVHDIVQGDSDDIESTIAWCESRKNELNMNSLKLSDTTKMIVRATGHKNDKMDSLAALVTSADLSILGQDPLRYDAYACAVREEYKRLHPAITARQFNEGRKKVLQYFMHLAEKGELYHDAHLAMIYTQSALANMLRECNELDA